MFCQRLRLRKRCMPSALRSTLVRPNPSIEGTSNIRLRLLLAAPHVKR